MNDHLGAAFAVGWAVLVVAVLLSFPIAESILGVFFIWGSLAAAALGIMILAMFRFRSNKTDSAIAIGLVVVAAATYAFSHAVVIEVGITFRTRLVEDRYVSELATITASEDPTLFEVPGRMMIDPGPPLRVAWVWWYGFLDNVGGVVNDPSRSADQARAVLTDDRTMRSTCTRLYDEWYYCAFN
jgi:hypothetical protein